MPLHSGDIERPHAHFYEYLAVINAFRFDGVGLEEMTEPCLSKSRTKYLLNANQSPGWSLHVPLGSCHFAKLKPSNLRMFIT